MNTVLVWRIPLQIEEALSPEFISLGAAILLHAPHRTSKLVWIATHESGTKDRDMCAYLFQEYSVGN